MTSARRTPEQRFWAKVHKTDLCWIWIGTIARGYGQFWDGQRVVGAHRFAYELLVDSIPGGLQLDHLCRNRRCVNPAHLEPVTRRENILRGAGVTARNAAKTHCVNGHELTPANTYIRPGARPGRECLTCNRAIWRERDQRRKAA